MTYGWMAELKEAAEDYKGIGWRQMTVDIDNILRLIERVEELEAQLSAPVEVKERGEG